MPSFTFTGLFFTRDRKEEVWHKNIDIANKSGKLEIAIRKRVIRRKWNHCCTGRWGLRVKRRVVASQFVTTFLCNAWGYFVYISSKSLFFLFNAEWLIARTQIGSWLIIAMRAACLFDPKGVKLCLIDCNLIVRFRGVEKNHLKINDS